MCSKPIFCSKIALKGKTCSRLLKPQKVAQKLPSTIGIGLVAVAYGAYERFQLEGFDWETCVLDRWSLTRGGAHGGPTVVRYIVLLHVYLFFSFRITDHYSDVKIWLIHLVEHSLLFVSC